VLVAHKYYSRHGALARRPVRLPPKPDKQTSASVSYFFET
jgi:hypothetical protein